jgi:hypothetical protein
MKTFLLSFIFLVLLVQLSASSLTVTAGQKVSITVTADGTQPFTYQWMKNGTPIPGATAVTYVIVATVVADSAAYTAKVSNAVGFTLSDDAVLTVNAPGGVAPSRANTTITVTTS